ncbi:MAG: hypothetical protein IT496_03540 [Gammaproteobacteria bacterium]|nr:hypothetical protein [Gammaproteobacteria bacterium]MCG3145599.1 hypothetical protein [Gammaproteobacteria bacterium]
MKQETRSSEPAQAGGLESGPEWHADPSSWPVVAVSWLLVGIPLLWGIYKTFQTAKVILFGT